MRETIASFSTSKAIKLLLVGLVAMAFVFVVTLYDFQRHTFAVHSSHTVGLPMAVIAWIFAFLFIVFEIALARKLVFQNGMALWIESGRLIYLHPWYQSVERNDVKHVSTDTSANPDKPSIVLQLRNGQRMRIECDLLSESPEVIAKRLREKLALA